MDWLRRYEDDLKWAFSQAKEIVAEFPSPFGEQAVQFLARFNLLEHEVPSNYICFLLPFWMQEAAPASRSIYRTLSIANILGLMSYHLLDHAMDKPDADVKQILPLSQLLQAEFTMIYSSFFPASSPFWNYYKQYLTQWAFAVALENKRDWLQEEPVRLGHKASLVKLTSTGLLILSGREAMIPEVEDAVDAVLVVLQMLDDWEDWRKDLEEGSYNSLVSAVKSQLSISEAVQPEVIREGLYTYGALTYYSEFAQKWQPAIVIVKESIPELYSYFYFLLNNLLAGAEEIEKERKSLELGGFQYWMSKNVKNV